MADARERDVAEDSQSVRSRASRRGGIAFASRPWLRRREPTVDKRFSTRQRGVGDNEDHDRAERFAGKPVEQRIASSAPRALILREEPSSLMAATCPLEAHTRDRWFT